MKIVIGIPTLNRYDLLKENLADLSTKFSDLDRLIIVDNGNQSIKVPAPLVSKTGIIINKKNLGVAASWNQIMKQAFQKHDADYILMLNDDIVLGKTRAELENIIKKYNVDFLYSSYFWSAYYMSKYCFEVVGEFDENFYPAYFEDNDYYYRMVLSKINFNNTPEMNPKVKRNSMTIKKDPAVNHRFIKNKEYFEQKWGGLPLAEKYTTPFNK